MTDFKNNLEEVKIDMSGERGDSNLDAVLKQMGKIEQLEQELQKTREQLERAERLIKMLPISCDIYTERIRSEYFKDKQGEG